MRHSTMKSKDIEKKLIEKNKEKIGLIKNELAWNLRCSTIAQMMYALTKKYVTKRENKFDDYKKCLESNKTILSLIQRAA